MKREYIMNDVIEMYEANVVMNDLVELFEANSLTLVLDVDNKIARCDRPAPRSRLGYKSEFHTRYQSVERMILVCTQFIEKRIANQKAKEERKIAQKLNKVALAADVKVGDLYVDSWGYEQTNVDAYQVVAKPSATTVIVRPIGYATVKDSEGYDCENVRLVPNSFKGEEMTKRLNNYGGFKTNSFSSASKTTADATHYRSWYY